MPILINYKVLISYKFYKNIFGFGGITLLVLGRMPGEYIVIDKRIIVKVIKSDSGNLRLAIEAPEDVQIVRGEIFEATQKFERK